MSKIAVVILNYNGKELLQKFLPCVIRYSDDADIIVADNCSSDGSAELVRKEFPSVRRIQIAENLGFCGGYNFALQQVNAPYYVLLNSDVEVTPGWLSPLIKLFDSHPTIAAVQPKVLSYHHKNRFEYAGAAGGFIDGLGYPYCRGRVFDTVEDDLGQYDDTCQVFWATGACLAIRASAFQTMGGFDTDFFAHMEEIDLCWKLNRSGQEIWYAGDSIVYHVGGGTLSRVNPRKTYLNFRNGLYLILKNMKATDLIWKLPFRIGLDWLAAFSFLASGSYRNAAAVWKAHVHFLRGMNRTINKRKLYRVLGFGVRRGLIRPWSVVVAYFISKQKTFRQLRG